MKTNELKNYIDNLTPKKKEIFIKEFCGELMEYQKFIDFHRDYLESLPTKELRIKETNRLKKEHYDKRL